MAYQDRTRDPQIDPTDGAMLERRSLSIASAAYTSDQSTDSFYAGDCGVLRASVVCSARSGTTPTCDISVMTCDTKDGTYYSAGTFTQLTATGSQRKSFAVDRWVRFDIDVGGTTPSFTMSFSGELV